MSVSTPDGNQNPFTGFAAYCRSMARDPDQASYAEELLMIAAQFDAAALQHDALNQLVRECSPGFSLSGATLDIARRVLAKSRVSTARTQ